MINKLNGSTDSLKCLGLVLSVFTIVGVGLGLTGYVSITWVSSIFVDPEAGEFAQSIGQMLVAMMFLQSIVITFFAGPTVAALTGLFSGVSLDDAKWAAGIGGIGSFFGFFIMVFIAVYVMAFAYTGGSSSGSGGSSEFDLVKGLKTAAKAGIPTAAVGTFSGYFGTRLVGIDLSVSAKTRTEQPQSSD